MAATKRARTDFMTNIEFIREMLHTRADSLVPPDGRIFIAERTNKVTDVWKGLIKHNFMSVPVLSKTKNKYYGFIDLADIVKFIVEHFGHEKLAADVDFFALHDQEAFWQTRTVNDIMTSRSGIKRNQFHPITKNYSLLSVFEMMAREPGLQRVPVLDQNRNLANLITNSQMVRYLHSHMKQLGSIKDKPISECSFNNEVVTINEKEYAVKAFQTMVSKNVTGIAVVDDSGKLQDNISMRDLKAIQSDARMFHRLYQTTNNFLQKIRKEFKGDRPTRVVAVKPTDTLEHAISLCADFGIHRVYVIDDQKKPIGVITLHDIFVEILNSV